MAGPRAAYLFLALLQAKVGRSLISCLGEMPPADVLRAPPAELARRTRIGEQALRTLEELRRSFDAGAVQRRLSEKGIRALTPADAGYPGRLRESPDPPPALFVRGRLPREEGAAVAVVGSRRASGAGIRTARALGRALGERGVCVVSGLALGVDAAAHEGALEAGGPALGVLGCGIDVVYPRTNHRIFEELRRNGAVVSEYYLGEAPLAWRFPARNRIIAGLCDATVVVEAPEKSGALLTAGHALECGREVWAVPGALAAPECRGSNRLLADGAGVLWDIGEFVDAHASAGGVGGGVPAPRPPAGPQLPDTEAAVLSGVGFEPAGVDALAERSGVGMDELLPALALLELKGYVKRDPGGVFVRRAAAP